MTTHTLLHTSDWSHILWHRPSFNHCGLVHSSSLVLVRNWNKLELLALSTELLVSMCCITCARRSWTHWTACSPLTGMAILRNKIGEVHGCAAVIVDIWRKEKTLETMLNKHTETGLWGLLFELISNSQSIMSLPGSLPCIQCVCRACGGKEIFQGRAVTGIPLTHRGSKVSSG